MKAAHVSRALWRFGFRQTIRGALIIGILGGLMMGAYGTVIVKTYPKQADRDALVQSLKATPAVNFLSGEVENAAQPASYGIYKSLPMLTLIPSIWGLMVATRLLRGNEEDGRLELLVSGATTRRQAGSWLLAGFGGSIVIGGVVMWVLTALLGAAPHVDLSPLEALNVTLAVFLPGLVFAGLGVMTSQLLMTRTRAVMYGFVPLLVLYCIRGAANTSDKLNWLKDLSPFGWSDLMNAVLNPRMLWVIPPLVCGTAFTVLGVYWAGKRDYATSLLRQREEVRSKLGLLASPFAFIIRQKRWTFFWWLVGTLAFVAFMASLAGMVSNILHSASSLHAVITISSEQLKLLFIGSTFMILCLILLGMSIMEISSIRREEAKSYLDNLLVQPVRRSSWLAERIGVTLAMVLVITAAAVLVVWVIAQAQGTDLAFAGAIKSAVGALGGVVLVLGVGVCLYGVWPRLAAIGMGIIVAWAFAIDIVRPIFHLDDWVDKTSVLYYIPADPSQVLKLSGVLWLVGIGVVLGGIGIRGFLKRDIEIE